MFYVYEHWRPDTNTCFYVGKGKNKRAWDLKNMRNRHFKAVVSKLISLGFAVDVRIISENLSEEDAIQLEIKRIAFYGMENLTNMTSGGDGLKNPTAETRKKISEAHKKRFENPEERKKMSLIKKGTKVTEETRQKLSRAGKLRRATPEARLNMSIAAKKRGISEETRAKINAARVGLKRSDEVKKAISEKLKGKIVSLETRAKLREAQLRRYSRTKQEAA
jgi:hypothetical protein